MDTRERIAERILVLRCQLGDECAFERLVLGHQAKLRYYVRRLVRDRDTAEDVLQAVWLAVWLELPRLRNLDAFPVWLYRIAHNKAVQSFRDEAPEVPLSDDPPSGWPEEDESFTAEEANAVHQALDKLCPVHNEVLLLRFLHNMSYEDIAEATGCPVGTVRSRIYYAKRALRRIMEQKESPQ